MSRFELVLHFRLISAELLDTLYLSVGKLGGEDMRVIHESKDGRFRVVERMDQYTDIEDLMGDTYNPKVNKDIDPTELERQKNEFISLVESDGVFGYVLERWNPAPGVGWEHVDSCWGFVGQYSPNEEIFNHYIVAELMGQIEGEKV